MSTFHRLQDSIVKINLLQSYCLNLYGCGLWDLQHRCFENICFFYGGQDCGVLENYHVTVVQLLLIF